MGDAQQAARASAAGYFPSGRELFLLVECERPPRPSMAAADLHWRKKEVSSLGELANIGEELHTDHSFCAERPVGHQGLPGVGTAECRSVACHAADAPACEIRDGI